mmetsp:Transcript_22383/g.45995  ORF Transcript_22383/g.45995 Transcript_22383/m.45995 type:complete len:82 (-) Transcript_22383:854-1099(-)
MNPLLQVYGNLKIVYLGGRQKKSYTSSDWYMAASSPSDGRAPSTFTTEKSGAAVGARRDATSNSATVLRSESPSSSSPLPS